MEPSFVADEDLRGLLSSPFELPADATLQPWDLDWLYAGDISNGIHDAVVTDGLPQAPPGQFDTSLDPFESGGSIPDTLFDQENISASFQPSGTTPFGIADTPIDSQWWDSFLNNEYCASAVYSGSECSSVTGFSAPTVQPQDDGFVDDKRKKKRRRTSPTTKRKLEQYFELHREDPYLSPEQVKRIAEETSLSCKQIRTYFANARARKLSPKTKAHSRNQSGLLLATSSATGTTEPVESLTNIGERMDDLDQTSRGSIAIGSRNHIEMSQQAPLERFLSSSPEEEGISADTIRKAAAGMNLSSPTQAPGSRKYSGTDSLSVSETANSSRSCSDSSLASIDSATSRGPRRGRKRPRETSSSKVQNVIRKPTDSVKVFQCTFCGREFAQKYDWRRHEESVHFPQREWVCMPDGPLWEDSAGIARCSFCTEVNPTQGHLDTHNCQSCVSSPPKSRTFTRKDKLLQHVSQVHKCNNMTEPMQSWCRPIERSVVIRCGICGTFLVNWAERNDHISSHFLEGRGMQYWMLAPGGITASDALADAGYSSPQRPGTAQFTCKSCEMGYSRLFHAVFHARMVHEVYELSFEAYLPLFEDNSSLVPQEEQPDTAPTTDFTPMLPVSSPLNYLTSAQDSQNDTINQFDQSLINMVPPIQQALLDQHVLMKTSRPLNPRLLSILNQEQRKNRQILNADEPMPNAPVFDSSSMSTASPPSPAFLSAAINPSITHASAFPSPFASPPIDPALASASSAPHPLTTPSTHSPPIPTLSPRHTNQAYTDWTFLAASRARQRSASSLNPAGEGTGGRFINPNPYLQPSPNGAIVPIGAMPGFAGGSAMEVRSGRALGRGNNVEGGEGRIRGMGVGNVWGPWGPGS